MDVQKKAVVEVTNEEAARIMAANVSAALLAATEEGLSQNRGSAWASVGRLLAQITSLGGLKPA